MYITVTKTNEKLLKKFTNKSINYLFTVFNCSYALLADVATV